MEPPVSVPIETRLPPVATATADPPLDPPGDRAGSSGWRAGPQAESSLVVPKANSCRLHLPTMTAPAALRRAVTVASDEATRPARTREAAVVGTPATSIRSLSDTGRPSSRESDSPRASRASAARAARAANSRVTVMNALRAGWWRSMVASVSCSSSVALISPARRRCAIARTDTAAAGAPGAAEGAAARLARESASDEAPAGVAGSRVGGGVAAGLSAARFQSASRR